MRHTHITTSKSQDWTFNRKRNVKKSKNKNLTTKLQKNNLKRNTRSQRLVWTAHRMKLDFNYYVTQLTLIIITITVSLLHVVTLQVQPCISAVTEYRYSVTRGPPGAPVNQVRGQEQGTITPSSGRNPGVWLARLCWGNIGSGYMPMTVSRTEPG